MQRYKPVLDSGACQEQITVHWRHKLLLGHFGPPEMKDTKVRSRVTR